MLYIGRMPAKTTQVNFRMPLHIVQWLDDYASALSEESGWKVTRTQALLRLISLAQPGEEERLLLSYQAKDMNISLDDLKFWKLGVQVMYEKEGMLNKDVDGAHYSKIYNQAMNDKGTRELAIRLGRESFWKRNGSM